MKTQYKVEIFKDGKLAFTNLLTVENAKADEAPHEALKALAQLYAPCEIVCRCFEHRWTSVLRFP